MVSIFGTGGGEEAAKRLSDLVGTEVPLLASIPFDVHLREGGDSGEPITLQIPDAPASKAVYQLLEKLMIRPKSLVGVPLSLHT